MDAAHIPLIPRLSEKSYGLRTQTTYVFTAPVEVNRNQIAAAVAAQYGVTVTGINVLLVKGKRKQSVRKRGRPVIGKRSDVKKAYVTLAEGDSIKLFDEEEKK